MTSPQSLDELIDEGMRLSRKLEDACDDLYEATERESSAENEYRKVKAVEWAGLRNMRVADAEAYVNGVTADLREARDLAQGQVRAGIELVRSLRTQVSLVQTAINTRREEAAFARTGPDTGP